MESINYKNKNIEREYVLYNVKKTIFKVKNNLLELEKKIELKEK